MNNRGFAATGILFIVLLLFIAMYVSLLSMFANRRNIYETIKNDIINGSKTENIILNKPSADIEIGATVKLEAEVKSDTVVDKTIIWKSSDENIATIDSSGVVKGISKGKVTITARTSNALIARSIVTVYNKANYGTNISNLYNNIYIRNSNQTEVITGTGNFREGVYSGNYKYPNSLANKMHDYDMDESIRLDVGPYGSSGFTSVLAGANTFNLARTTKNKWIRVFVRAGGGTTGVSVSNLKLHFSDNVKLSLNESITRGYIEPLVIASSSAHVNDYIWNNFYNILDVNGSTGVGNYPEGTIIFKVKNKSTLKAIELTSNKNFDSNYDGLEIYEYQNIELSTTSFE